MSGLNKGLAKVEVAVKWDPSPLGTPPHDLDLVAATYAADDLHGEPVYLVYFDSRSPDGTITLDRDSRTGQGFGFDEVMVLELERLADSYARVLVGVAVQQGEQRKTFGDVDGTGLRVREGVTELAVDDLAAVSGATAAIVAEFTRDESGAWHFHEGVRGFDTDPTSFAHMMGSAVI
ncbi:TerD-family protein [Streptomyces sulfonofaciens]|uniref:TerD-family protein n=1 Tax=Streptomyces sulfonofaciens TaxID=68272 RepID=A0A919GNJ3_9ACTN|nr:TerD family protein [Streptomyces sulfonofaciens]GHH88100.1 TerD-family protein [Streptomyces sulfonofaciens]